MQQEVQAVEQDQLSLMQGIHTFPVGNDLVWSGRSTDGVQAVPGRLHCLQLGLHSLPTTTQHSAQHQLTTTQLLHNFASVQLLFLDAFGSLGFLC